MDVLLLSGTLLFVHSLIDNLLLQPGAAAILHGLLEFVGLHVSCEDMALDSHSTLLALASRNAIHYIVNPDPIRLVLSMVSLSLATMVWMICGKLLLLRSDLISYSTAIQHYSVSYIPSVYDFVVVACDKLTGNALRSLSGAARFITSKGFSLAARHNTNAVYHLSCQEPCNVSHEFRPVHVSETASDELKPIKSYEAITELASPPSEVMLPSHLPVLESTGDVDIAVAVYSPLEHSPLHTPTQISTPSTPQLSPWSRQCIEGSPLTTLLTSSIRHKHEATQGSPLRNPFVQQSGTGELQGTDQPQVLAGGSDSDLAGSHLAEDLRNATREVEHAGPPEFPPGLQRVAGYNNQPLEAQRVNPSGGEEHPSVRNGEQSDEASAHPPPPHCNCGDCRVAGANRHPLQRYPSTDSWDTESMGTVCPTEQVAIPSRWPDNPEIVIEHMALLCMQERHILRISQLKKREYQRKLKEDRQRNDRGMYLKDSMDLAKERRKIKSIREGIRDCIQNYNDVACGKFGGTMLIHLAGLHSADMVNEVERLYLRMLDEGTDYGGILLLYAVADRSWTKAGSELMRKHGINFVTTTYCDIPVVRAEMNPTVA